MRSLPAALQRSHRSSVAGATKSWGGVRVGVIAFLLWSSPTNALHYVAVPHIVQHLGGDERSRRTPLTKVTVGARRAVFIACRRTYHKSATRKVTAGVRRP